jgi:TRAP-type C4-dicarboxylate transport system substrate-binding protein
MNNSKRVKILLVGAGVTLALILTFGVRFTCAADKNISNVTKPLVMKVAIWTPANMPYAKACGWILEEVENRSNGRLKFEYYYSESLLPARETLSGLQSGIADVAFLPTNYTPGKTPLCTVTSLPMTGQRFYSSALAFADVNKLPAVKAELGKYNVRYLSFLLGSSYHIWTNKPVRKITDIKGKKIRGVGGQDILLKELGAVPVSIVSTEVYTALERGTIDGSLANPVFAFDYKYVEVAKYLYQMYLGTLGMVLGINTNSWNKLPADIQQMFHDEALLERAAIRGHEFYESLGDKNIKETEAKGALIRVVPTKEEIAYVTKLAKETAWKEWVEKMRKLNLPGQEVLDTYLKALEKWEARSPFK